MLRINCRQLAAVAIALCMLVTAGAAAAYFTTYVSAKGGHVLQLGSEVQIDEKIEGMDKIVSMKNTGDTDAYVRIKLLYSSVTNDVDVQLNENWTAGSDGYYYYKKVVEPGSVTEDIRSAVTVKEKPNELFMQEEFDVVVIAECTQYIYEGENTPDYQGWKEAI